MSEVVTGRESLSTERPSWTRQWNARVGAGGGGQEGRGGGSAAGRHQVYEDYAGGEGES